MSEPKNLPSSNSETPARRVIGAPRAAGLSSSPSLDAPSIYTTRATTRRHQAQRRRLLQNSLGILLLLLLGIGAWLWLRMPRAPQLALQWQRQLPATFGAAPVVAQSGTQEWLLLPTLQGRLLKFDVKKATFSAIEAGDFALRAAPLVEKNRLYIGSEDGVLRAFAWTNGRQIWQAKTNAAITSRPITVAKNAGISEDLVAFGDEDGIVMGVNARDGKLRWRQRLDGPVGAGLETVGGVRPLILVPVLSGALARGGLRALAARDGREVWRYPTDRSIFAAQIASPLVAQIEGKTRVFCVDDAGVVTALNAQTGGRTTTPNSYEWKIFVPALPQTPTDRAVSFRVAPRLLNGVGAASLLIIGGNDGGVRALDARNGKVRWSFAMTAPIADIAVAGSDVFALDDQGIGWRLAGATGAPLARWRIEVTRATYRGLAVAPQSGQLFAVARGQVSSFAVANGAAR